MDQHTQDILEFHRIKDILTSYATSSLGKALAASIHPDNDIQRIEIWQKQVSELKQILRDSRLPLGGIRDIRKSLDETKDPAIVLGCDALLEVHSTLQAARNIKGYLWDLGEDYPNLSALGQKIGIFKEIEDAIFASVDMNARIKDNATPKLHSIRKEIDVKRARIKSKLQSLLRSPRLSKYLQGGAITIRNGRSVIPVKANFRDRVPGVIRDQSDSGETLFIEPDALSGAGDELQRLLQEEKQEMFRILQEITEQIRTKKDEISKTLRALSMIDLIYAKTCFSRDFDMSEPILNQNGRIDIKTARHPLLVYDRSQDKEDANQEPVIPIDVRLGDDFDTLVITGPNTGGKTVTLKTIGLLSLMAQAGLHVPTSPGSHLAVFRDILADIGDEQSLQQNLSTFSSHLVQIVRILHQSDHSTLVLLDELGTGTDPQEGAALGTAIVDFLLKKGSRTVATTHLSALKTYAHIHPRIENASVEFDMETLQPTYRLLIGAFGSSNALAIAQRLGAPTEVISRASELVEDDDERVEELVNALQQLKVQIENERETLAKTKEDTLEMRQRYETMLRDVEIKRKKLAKLIPDEPDISQGEDAEPIPVTLDSLQRGDTVKILSLNTEGKVVAKMQDKNKLIVSTNMMKVEVRPEDLQMVAKK